MNKIARISFNRFWGYLRVVLFISYIIVSLLVLKEIANDYQTEISTPLTIKDFFEQVYMLIFINFYPLLLVPKNPEEKDNYHEERHNI
ncbi:hypothetical protein [Pantoea agglomerans]|uniref:hypothetical protein n=1 Tax=Enterobacter agglomerans TaxID=549 RepID=UPI003C7B3BA6